MSHIEPTEEQKQAAQAFLFSRGPMNAGLVPRPHDINDIARLLAEREAKLLVDNCRVAIERNALRADNDALRARVAELEAFTRLTGAERTSTMFAAGLDVVTRAVREADQLHQTVGGGTRHYVNECLLPCFKDEGLAIIVVGKAYYDDAKADAPASTKGGEG